MATRIYTRTGDAGETGLFGGQRVRKDDLRVEAYGATDELNAALGMAIAQGAEPEIRSRLLEFQHDLFTLGGDLATPIESPEENEADRTKGRVTIARLDAARTAALEGWIDRYTAELLPLTRFILPGGHPLAAYLHLARTICRRAERHCVTLAYAGGEPEAAVVINPEIIRYLNRLSDLLFTLARLANHRLGVADIVWNPDNAGK